MSENYEISSGGDTSELIRRLRSLARFNQSLIGGRMGVANPVLREELELWPTAFEKQDRDITSFKPQSVLVYAPAVVGNIPRESASAKIVKKPDMYGSALRVLGVLAFDSVALINVEGDSASGSPRSLHAMDEPSFFDTRYSGPIIVLQVGIQNEGTNCIVPISTPTVHHVITQVATVFKNITTGSLQ